MIELYHGDCLKVIHDIDCGWDTAFLDIPDNIGLEYAGYKDSLSLQEYAKHIEAWLFEFFARSESLWISFNARWSMLLGHIVMSTGLDKYTTPYVQTYTFGTYCTKRLANCHRPLYLLQKENAPLFLDRIRIQSARQLQGDKRADPRGRIPPDTFRFPPHCTDLPEETNFEFQRVTGNSRQRRKYHPTQLNEGLVERCLLMTTPEGGTVIDPFLGSATTFRVAKKLGFDCTGIEISETYIEKVVEEHGLEPTSGSYYQKV